MLPLQLRKVTFKVRGLHVIVKSIKQHLKNTPRDRKEGNTCLYSLCLCCVIEN